MSITICSIHRHLSSDPHSDVHGFSGIRIPVIASTLPIVRYFVLLIVCCLMAAVPPLSHDQRGRLAAVSDATDQPDEAFAALLENAAQWTPGIGDAPISMEPDLDAMLAGPAAYRGRLCRIAGRIEQQTWMAAPHDDVAEWFLRDDAGRPILVYVSGLDRGHEFRDGRSVVLPARFYKTVEARARDGRTRRYPAFVGVFPRTEAVAPWSRMWAVAVPVGIMLMVFLALLVYARRGARPRGVRLWSGAPVSGPADDTLPADPASALAELRRRAETAK